MCCVMLMLCNTCVVVYCVVLRCETSLLCFCVQAKENFKVKESFETLIRYVLKANPKAGLASGSGGVFGAGMDNDVSREAEETDRQKQQKQQSQEGGQTGSKKDDKKEKKKGKCIIL